MSFRSFVSILDIYNICEIIANHIYANVFEIEASI